MNKPAFPWKTMVLWMIFGAYLWIILHITVLRSGFLSGPLLENGVLNLVPFADYAQVWQSGGPRRLVYLLGGNILCFLPFGFLVSALFRKGWKRTLFYGFLFSFLIESLQFVFGTGITELDDLILNTLAFMYKIDAPYFSAPQAHTRKKLIATANRREGVYNRTGAQSVTFCEKGGARKRADVFLDKEKRSKANFAPTWAFFLAPNFLMSVLHVWPLLQSAVPIKEPLGARVA